MHEEFEICRRNVILMNEEQRNDVVGENEMRDMLNLAFSMHLNDGIVELGSTSNACEGDEQPNDETKNFYALLRYANELYPRCNRFTKLF